MLSYFLTTKDIFSYFLHNNKKTSKSPYLETQIMINDFLGQQKEYFYCGKKKEFFSSKLILCVAEFKLN